MKASFLSRTIRITAFVLLLLAHCTGAGAQNVSASKERKAKLEKDIKILEQQISNVGKRSSSAATSLSLLQEKSAARRELLRESERELSLIEDSVRTTRREVARLQERLDTLTSQYSRLVNTAYRNRDPRMWYMYILASDNIAQGLRRFSYLRDLSSRMNRQAGAIIAERDTLEIKQARLDSLRAEAKLIRDDRARELDKLQKEEKRSRELISQLKKEKGKYEKQLADKRREVERLNREIEKMIQAAMDGDDGKKGKGGKGTSGGKTTSTQIDKALSGEFAANKGRLPWPADGRVVSRFGRHPHPVYTSVTMPFNNGVGIAVPEGAPAKAVFNGTVKQIVVIPGYNQCVLVQHGEYFTFYCKLSSVSVKAGDKVKTGQVIGSVMTLGDETQLHFQLWKGKSPQDPEKWLK